ncbi:pectinesterase family protein [Paenibacillus chondroitinus]|uniref:Pectinesterase family protein n=1 Tax=Paenibacillus chondroitinus TaxID=59842 RepID=A0ABU6DJ02_9BACL|nr:MULTISPECIES: pectinesterase family protein [Paenibacillus]MCY9660300.1 pectinesterase family protein [Paenibacillus anseongense]MEB4797726.1 pectinesterase family protein [Paenibacillus chondroitinus]
MPSTTMNLGLYKKNPSTDGNDTFDINTMLNDNWDRVDAQLGAQFADAAPTPVNLVNGLQVVDVPQTAPLENLRITGRTLVNLLGRDGNCEDLSKWSAFQSTQSLNTANIKYGNNSIKVTATSANYAATCKNNISLPSGNKYLVLAEFNAGTAPYAAIEVTSAIGVSTGVTTTTGFGLAYRKFISTGSVGINLYTIATAAGQFFYVDGVRLYALSDAEYSAIDGMTTTQIAAKYPYVDDVKHVTAPYVIKYGENLLPPLYDYNLNSGSPTIVSPYSGLVTNNDKFIIQIPVIAGQAYSISATSFDTNGRIFVAENGGATKVDISGSGLLKSENFTIGAGITQINIRLLGLSATPTAMSNPILNLGSTAKPFVGRNDNLITFPNVRLAGSIDGTVYDTLFERDGKYFIERRFHEVTLDGRLNWGINTDFTGYKRVYINVGANITANTQRGVKYDGKILGAISAVDGIQLNNDGNLFLDIADTDSGWGESYLPSNDEVKAYFYGWKMYDGVNGANSYVSGTKAWCYRASVGYSGGTNTLPTVIIPANGFWSPYRISYQLATPLFQEISVEGGISFHEGLNKIEVGQGMIVREKANPNTADPGFYRFNSSYLFDSKLTNRTSRILTIYKNGKVDTAKWILINGLDSGFAYGTQYAQISAANFDSTAVYEVTYLALEQYLLSIPVQAITGQVASNLKTVVEILATDQADNEARLSATEQLAQQIYNVPKQTTAPMSLYVDAVNGVDNNDGSATRPFKTIQRAVNSIPQIVSHLCTIYVAAGTYAEDVTVLNYTGQITIIAANTAQDATKVNSISINHCKGRFEVTGFTATSATTPGFNALYCDAAIFNTCWVTAFSATQPAFAYVTSVGRVQAGAAAGRTVGILATSYSQIAVVQVGGSGNSVGVQSEYGSHIGIHSVPTPTGSINFVTQLGGLIVSTNGVLNPWGDNTQDQRTAVLAQHATAGVAVSANVDTFLTYTTAVNQGGAWDGVNKFTAPSDGWYLISAHNSFVGVSGTPNIVYSVYIDGVGYLENMGAHMVQSASTYCNGAANKIIKLTKGQYFRVAVNINQACTTNPDARASRLEIVRIA